MAKRDKYDAMTNEELNIIIAQRTGLEIADWATDCNTMMNLLGCLEDAMWKVDFAKLDRSQGDTTAHAVARLGAIVFLRWSDKVAQRDMEITIARMAARG
jgi:hypothetical protein